MPNLKIMIGEALWGIANVTEKLTSLTISASKVLAKMAQKEDELTALKHEEFSKMIISLVRITIPIPSRKRNTVKAPPYALNMMHFFLPKSIREPLIGDILEEFPEQLERFGPFLAKVWVWKECIVSLGVSLFDWLVSKVSIVDAVQKIRGDNKR